jgi:hypothetical protein
VTEPRDDSVANLVADAAALGRGLGLAIADPVVLKQSLNLVVWLRPSPVVARIQVRTGLVRDPDAFAGGVELAAFLAAAGLPVSAPTDLVHPGPHIGASGRVMTLWRHLKLDDDEPDPAEAGVALARIHEVAAGFEGPMRHVGPLVEIERLAARIADWQPAEAARLRRLLERIDLPDLSGQALHGDAHLGNVVMSGSRVCWLDWEESWRGPVAWDLAALDHRRRVLREKVAGIGRAFDGYGRHDAEAVEAWAPVVALWAAAWGVLGSQANPEWSKNTRRRLEWLERRLAR